MLEIGVMNFLYDCMLFLVVCEDIIIKNWIVWGFFKLGWWWFWILYIIFVVCFLVVFDSMVKVWIDDNIYFWGRVESRLIVYVWESGGCGSSGGGLI